MGHRPNEAVARTGTFWEHHRRVLRGRSQLAHQLHEPTGGGASRPWARRARGRTLWDEFPDAVATSFYDECRRAVSDPPAVEFDAYYPPLARWCDVRDNPSDGGLAIYFRDIGDRTQAEEALRTPEAHVRLLSPPRPMHSMRSTRRPGSGR